MNEVERLNILNQYGILDTPHEEPFERIAALARLIFDTPIEQRYERAVALLGIDPRMLSQEAGHA